MRKGDKVIDNLSEGAGESADAPEEPEAPDEVQLTAAGADTDQEPLFSTKKKKRRLKSRINATYDD